MFGTILILIFWINFGNDRVRENPGSNEIVRQEGIVEDSSGGDVVCLIAITVDFNL